MIVYRSGDDGLTGHLVLICSKKVRDNVPLRFYFNLGWEVRLAIGCFCSMELRIISHHSGGGLRQRRGFELFIKGHVEVPRGSSAAIFGSYEVINNIASNDVAVSIRYLLYIVIR